MRRNSLCALWPLDPTADSFERRPESWMYLDPMLPHSENKYHYLVCCYFLANHPPVILVSGKTCSLTPAATPATTCDCGFLSFPAARPETVPTCATWAPTGDESIKMCVFLFLVKQQDLSPQTRTGDLSVTRQSKSSSVLSDLWVLVRLSDRKLSSTFSKWNPALFFSLHHLKHSETSWFPHCASH